MSLTQEQEAANFHTFRHIEKVRNYLGKMCCALLKRAEKHDQSKLDSPEVEIFTKLTPILSNLTYGSPEYEESRLQLGPALDHHYAKNRHHPEHWPAIESKEADIIEKHINQLLNDGIARDCELIEVLQYYVLSLRSPINNMNLLDHNEMFCDWKASSERHNDGNIRKSIEHNAKRFGMSKQLVKIYENTVDLFTDDDK